MKKHVREILPEEVISDMDLKGQIGTLKTKTRGKCIQTEGIICTKAQKYE